MNRSTDFALLLLPAAIWASLVVVGVSVLTDVGPVALACITWAVAAVVLVGATFQRLRSHAATLRHEIWLLAISALTGVAAFQAFWFDGLLSANPVNVAVLTATLPVMIAAAAALFLGERLGAIQSVGVVFTIAGAVWIGVAGEIDQLRIAHFGHGEALILLANVSMATYTVILKRRPSALPPLEFMAITALLGALMLLPWAIAEADSAASWERIVRHWQGILYIGVVASAAAYVLWNRSVVRNGANLTGMSLYTQPLFGVAFCYVFLGQPVLSYHWLGLLLICVGVLLVVLTGEGAQTLRHAGSA